MKQIARSIVVAILGWQVRRLRNKHTFKVVAVVGSIGKTSTKFAIAQVLSEKYKVRFQEGNYNDLAIAPLVFFGHTLPNLFNPFAWATVFVKNEFQILNSYPFDIVVVEVGTDGPGQIAAFRKYLQLDLAVLTSITPEHMEFFEDLDAVAKEELSVVQYTEQLLLNADLVASEYQSLVPEAITYSLHNKADYKISKFVFQNDGVDFVLDKAGKTLVKGSHAGISEPHLYSLTAASAVADLMGMEPEAIVSGLAHIQPVSGRMQRLNGIKNSVIIDDTYNASPEAVKAALETLYRIKAPQKIALLGNMNELGDYSADAHLEVAAYCDPKQLDELITLGPDANEYLALAAEKNGCKVTKCNTPYEAGEHLKKIIKEGAVILAKGSQNRVYAEEAVKIILADPADVSRLVRQSPAWLKKKAKNFSI